MGDSTDQGPEPSQVVPGGIYSMISIISENVAVPLFLTVIVYVADPPGIKAPDEINLEICNKGAAFIKTVAFAVAV